MQSKTTTNTPAAWRIWTDEETGTVSFSFDWDDDHGSFCYEDGDQAEAVAEAIELLGDLWTGGTVSDRFEAEPLAELLRNRAAIERTKARTTTDDAEALAAFRLADRLRDLALCVSTSEEEAAMHADWEHENTVELVREFLTLWDASHHLCVEEDGQDMTTASQLFERSIGHGFGERWTVTAGSGWVRFECRGRHDYAHNWEAVGTECAELFGVWFAAYNIADDYRKHNDGDAAEMLKVLAAQPVERLTEIFEAFEALLPEWSGTVLDCLTAAVFLTRDTPGA